MCSPTEGGKLEADGGDSLTKGSSLLLASDSGRVVGAASVEGKGSSGSTVGQGSGTGGLGSSLSAGDSGEGDLGTTGSRLEASSRRKSRGLKVGALDILLLLLLLLVPQAVLGSFKEGSEHGGSNLALV